MSPGRGAGRRLGPAAVLTLLWLLLGLLGANPAAAHAELVSTSPANGAELTRAPRALTLTFSEPVRPVRGSFTLRDVADAPVRILAPTRSAKTLRTPVPTGLAPGFYLFSFRVVSVDNHPIAGSVSFDITGSAASAPPPDHGGHGRPAGYAEGEPLAGTAGLLRWTSYVGAALLLGIPAFGFWCLPGAGRNPRLRRACLLGGALVILTGLLAVPVQAARLAGTGIGGAFTAGRIGEVLDSRFGTTIGWRLALTVVLIGLLANAARRRDRYSTLAAAAGAAGLALSYARIGHPGAGSLPVLTTSADAMHLLAMSVWLGGLAVLAVHLLPDPPADVARVLARWSRLAMGAVLVLVATGIFQAAWRLRGLGALPATGYGRWILAKSVLLAAMLAVANLGRIRVHRLVLAGPRPLGASLGAALAAEPRDQRGRGLRRSVGVELAFGVLVLVFTVFLTTTAPPH